jgi:hypothetical protein
LAQLIHVVRQGADSNELISFEEMFDIEESVPTEETYDGEWEKSLVEQFKKREDSEISECESDDEGDDVEMDNTGSEYSHQDMLYGIEHVYFLCKRSLVITHVNLGNKMFQHMFSVSSLEGTDNPEIQRLEFRGCVWWQKM